VHVCVCVCVCKGGEPGASVGRLSQHAATVLPDLRPLADTTYVHSRCLRECETRDVLETAVYTRGGSTC